MKKFFDVLMVIIMLASVLFMTAGALFDISAICLWIFSFFFSIPGFHDWPIKTVLVKSTIMFLAGAVGLMLFATIYRFIVRVAKWIKEYKEFNLINFFDL